MNRKQRRVLLKQSASSGRGPSAPDPARQLFAAAIEYERQNRPNDAIRAYKRLLALRPDDATANNNLGCLLQAQGRLEEASAYFAHALYLRPQLFGDFNGAFLTLAAVSPRTSAAMERATKAWPARLPRDELLDAGGFAATAAEPLLLCMLQSVPVRKIELERLLTDLRLSLLDDAVTGVRADSRTIAFCCAMATQCFINEYVFSTTAEEDAKVERLGATVDAALAAGAEVAPLSLMALAMYRPLHALTGAQKIPGREWPAAVDAVVTLQLREPMQELALREAIPRLTAIDDETSQRVRQQYEENPYPRWTHLPGGIEPVSFDQYLRDIFPTAAFTPIGKSEGVDVLVAGCGTGSQTTGIAQKYLGAKILAVDLSLASLAYAKRATPPELAGQIEYAQADILKLGGIARDFDVIFATGVLHHMADPMEGWRILLTRLRPGGLMQLGLYSELARADLVAARTLIAERGYGATPAEIRRCRQDIVATPLQSVARYNDFFSTSECRDMLLHVQETRVTIPAIKAFVATQGLKFIGFELDAKSLQRFRSMFAAAGASMSDLDRWHAAETQYPRTFESMYQFWVQKA